jgi:hypothetical protein
MCKVQISVGKTRDKKRTAKNLFGPAENMLLVLKVYITILHLAYRLSMYKLTVLGIAVETTTHRYLILIRSEENGQLFLCYEVLGSHGEQYKITALGDGKISANISDRYFTSSFKKIYLQVISIKTLTPT